ncbi:hypothetical protein HQ571_01175 [Candidatus Kuenenbacteria bacterium]|nr:hypothetical protein [Candidatus Kuenenbacteria bacterium]
MLDKKFWKKTLEDQSEYDISRRKIISEASGAQHLAKQAIFALQRDDKQEAEEKIAVAKEGLISLEKRFGKDGKLRTEGVWKAAVEEFVEAKLFMDFIKKKDIQGIEEFFVLPDEYIGGLSDVTGEILRMMVLWTTKGNIEEVKNSAEVISEIIHELMQYNYGGYLRTKFDQAKRSLQKAEQILYDLSIRKK